jgi:hypothetical protein
MNLSNVTSTQLRRAAGIKDKIHRLEKQLRKLLLPPPVEPVAKPVKSKMTAAARRKLSVAMKASWAARRK